MAGRIELGRLTTILSSRQGRGYLAYALLCAALSALVGYGYYYSSVRWFEVYRGEEKVTALQVVDAFFTTYSDLRGPYMRNEAPVPASFRAHAIARFNQFRDPDNQLRLLMVGVPGREILTAPIDPQMREAVAALAERPEAIPPPSFIEVGGRTYLRTFYPSIASHRSCVDCHNELQPQGPRWRLNEVMGAFVADVPATPFLTQVRITAFGIAMALFALSSTLGIRIFRSQARRLVREARRVAIERIGEAIEQMHDGFVLFDDKDRLVLCNSIQRNRYRELAHLLKPGVDRRDFAAAVQDFVVRPERDGARPVQKLHLPDDTWVRVSETGLLSGYTMRIETDITDIERHARELQQAMQSAENANRAKSNFLAQMGHELRTPLNAVLAFSEIIRDQVLGPDAQPRYARYASDIHVSGEHLMSLINDLLDLAKIEARKYAIAPSEVDVAEVAETCRTMLAVKAEQRGVRLELQIAHNGAIIHADERAVLQVLLNLLSNAVKFTPEGGQVALRTEVGKNGTLAIAVDDDGVGIPSELLPNIFEPFGQVRGAQNGTPGGTGLGLSISKSLMELHEGEIRIVNRPEGGITASAVFPAHRVVRLSISATGG
jgi:signal transduction histidine kinase